MCPHRMLRTGLRECVQYEKTVGTRLHRVRHSWNIGPRLINHGRDAIGSLPLYAHLDIFEAPFSMNLLFNKKAATNYNSS
jgi:hypothetical protein